MLGADRRALWNVLRNKASPSPTYFEYSSAPVIDKYISKLQKRGRGEEQDSDWGEHKI
jgi:hypothetical protein